MAGGDQAGRAARCALPARGTARSRSGPGAVWNITAAYPELHALADHLCGTPAVLDGEIVALEEQGRPDFERLQTRMGLARSPARAARLTSWVPAHLFFFDVMRRGVPMNVTVTIDPRLIERALPGPGGIGARLLQRRAERVAQRARELAPGTMAEHITTRVEDTRRGLVAYVVSEHSASQYVIHGTRSHIIRPRRARALRFEVGGRVVYAVYVHPPAAGRTISWAEPCVKLYETRKITHSSRPHDE